MSFVKGGFVVVVRMRMRRTACAIHPFGNALDIVFLFPDRYTGFHLVDHKTTGFEGRVAVLRCCANPHSQLADLQMSDPVGTANIDEIKSLFGFGKNLFAFTLRELRIDFILQRRNGTSIIVIAYPSSGCARPRFRVSAMIGLSVIENMATYVSLT
ncbi:MAG: hypothetical protein O3A51_09090 [Verrucomicrobia bacterium]|nr:hypothetical protein [Verrucomicrobiota bacterium]